MNDIICTFLIYVLFECPDYPETNPVKNQTTQMLGLHLPHLQSQLFQTAFHLHTSPTLNSKTQAWQQRYTLPIIVLISVLIWIKTFRIQSSQIDFVYIFFNNRIYSTVHWKMPSILLCHQKKLLTRKSRDGQREQVCLFQTLLSTLTWMSELLITVTV